MVEQVHHKQADIKESALLSPVVNLAVSPESVIQVQFRLYKMQHNFTVRSNNVI